MQQHKKLLMITVEEILFLAAYDGVKGQFKEDYHYDSGLTRAQIFLRPCLREFLDFCFDNFQVALWSEYSEEMTRDALQRLYGDSWENRLEFLLGRFDCVPPSNDRYKVEGMFETRSRCKSLDVIMDKGYSPDDIIIVDDDPKKWEPYGKIPPSCWVLATPIRKGFGNIIIDGDFFSHEDRSILDVRDKLVKRL